MPDFHHHLSILALTCAVGCAPDHISWDQGQDAVRSALWVDLESGGTAIRRIFVSNGIVDCAQPDLDDPAAQELALERILSALIREDAHHVLFTLVGDGEAWQGDWVLLESTSWEPGDAVASYVHLEEVVVSGGGSLSPSYDVTECTEAEMAPGELALEPEEGGEMSGHFELSSPEVSGSFTATRCEPTDDLVPLLLYSDPGRLCPSDAQ